MKIIADQNDPNYFCMRAIEYVAEAKMSNNYEEYEAKMMNAIRMLALAIETKRPC